MKLEILKKFCGIFLFSCAFAFVDEVGSYLRYCRQLDFYQAPDYAYLRQLWWDIFKREGFKDDGVYDWTKTSGSKRGKSNSSGKKPKQVSLKAPTPRLSVSNP